MFENRYQQKFDLYRIFKHCKSIQIALGLKKAFPKQLPNGLYRIDRSLNSASQPVKKRRALFSSVDSPSQGKRFLVLLVLFFNECRQWRP